MFDFAIFIDHFIIMVCALFSYIKNDVSFLIKGICVSLVYAFLMYLLDRIY